MPNDTVELASPAWIALADAYLTSAIPALGADAEGVRFSMCEAVGDAAADAFEALPAAVRSSLTGLHNYLAPLTG